VEEDEEDYQVPVEPHVRRLTEEAGEEEEEEEEGP